MHRFWTLAAAMFFMGGTGLVVHHWEDQLASIGVERRYFSTLIDQQEADYLAGLRDTHLGCKTLLYRNPELVFFGDSHTYAGWDYTILQRKLPVRIGSCALSGAFPENVCDLLEAIKSNGLCTRYLILGISPRMVWDVPERQHRIERARLELASLGQPRENFVTLVNRQWRKIDRFDGAEKRMAAAIKRLDEGLETIPPEQIDRFLAEHSGEFHATQFWLDYVAQGRPFEGLNAVIAQIGRKAEACGVRLGVVYIPESRWLNRLYTAAQRQHFQEACQAFARIASWHNIDWFNGGAENGNYVNRYMLLDYPYHTWNDPYAARTWIAEDAQSRQWQLFDPDHMSALGAARFTEDMAPKIREWIESCERPPQATRR